jgi:hypothetical protein
MHEHVNTQLRTYSDIKYNFNDTNLRLAINIIIDYDSLSLHRPSPIMFKNPAFTRRCPEKPPADSPQYPRREYFYTVAIWSCSYSWGTALLPSTDNLTGRLPI